jgi:hypothetical protein
MTFTGIEKLAGGLGDDRFTLDTGVLSFGGTLWGDEGTDELRATDGTNAWAVTSTNAGTLNGDTIFTTMETLTGGTGGDTLTGANTTNTWTLTSGNGGTVTGLSGGFRNMESLAGGTDRDDFNFNAELNWAGSLTVDGRAGEDTINLPGGITVGSTLSATAETINLGGAISTGGAQSYAGTVVLVADAALTGAGVNFGGTVDGAHDLTLAVSGATTFNGAVGGSAPSGLGDGTDASLRINSKGTTTFAQTVRTSQGIVQANDAGQVTFSKNVDVVGRTTPTEFSGNVALHGLTFTSAGPVTFGTASTDQVTLLGGAVKIDTSRANAPVTFNSRVNGTDAGPTLEIDSRNGSTGGGAVAFRAAVGEGVDGLTLDVRSAEFDGTVRLGTQGLRVTATDRVGFADAVNTGGPVSLQAGGRITTKGVTATTGNIEIHATGTDGDLLVNGPVKASWGGVSLVSDLGRIYTNGKDSLNVAITGYSDDDPDKAPAQRLGVDLDTRPAPPDPAAPPDWQPGKAAIVIQSHGSLSLGPQAVLTAKGQYYSGDAAHDDRIPIGLRHNGPRTDSGDPLDVAIYLKAGGAVPIVSSGPKPDHEDITVNSKAISISQQGGGVGTLVVDAADTVAFGKKFDGYLRAGGDLQRIEVVSRMSPADLSTVAIWGTLPHADDLYDVHAWPNFQGVDYRRYFNGTYPDDYVIYLLRGGDPAIASPLFEVMPFQQAAPVPVVVAVDVVERVPPVVRGRDATQILGEALRIPHPDCMSEDQQDTAQCQTVGDLLAVDPSLVAGVLARIEAVDRRLLPDETPEGRQERLMRLEALAKHWPPVNSSNLRQIQTEARNTPGLLEWMESAVDFVRILHVPLHKSLRWSSDTFLLTYLASSEQLQRFMRTYIEVRLTQDDAPVFSSEAE